MSVWYNGTMSNTVALLYRVPWGSVLGPLLFVPYLAEVFAVVKQFGFWFMATLTICNCMTM